MHATIKRIGPEEAKGLLQAASGRNYRRLSQRLVNVYASEMARGLWKSNGESLKFNGDGTLIDGQHRLNAVIQAGRSVEFLCVYEVETDASIDTGRRRTFGDELRHRNYPNYSAIAGVVKIVLHYEQGYANRNHLNQSYGVQTLVERFLQEEQRFVDVGTCIAGGGARKYVPPSSLGLIGIKGCDGMPSDNEAYQMYQAVIADGSIAESPMFLLRERMIREKLTPNRMLSDKIARALAVKAWNAFVVGDTPKRLSFNAVKEDFPKIVMVRSDGELCDTP